MSQRRERRRARQRARGTRRDPGVTLDQVREQATRVARLRGSNDSAPTRECVAEAFVLADMLDEAGVPEAAGDKIWEATPTSRFRLYTVKVFDAYPTREKRLATFRFPMSEKIYGIRDFRHKLLRGREPKEQDIPVYETYLEFPHIEAKIREKFPALLEEHGVGPNTAIDWQDLARSNARAARWHMIAPPQRGHVWGEVVLRVAITKAKTLSDGRAVVRRRAS